MKLNVINGVANVHIFLAAVKISIRTCHTASGTRCVARQTEFSDEQTQESLLLIAYQCS